MFARALLVAVAALFTVAFAHSDYPMTITDGLGNEITLKEAPKRVSSKTLFTDEVLLSLLPSERFTSLTNFAADPTYSNVANQLPEGIPLLDLNVEAILANQPDIVFAANWSDAGIVTQLKQAGIPVYLVNTPFTVEAIQAEILKLGDLLNVHEEAEALVASMDAKLESYSAKVADIKAAKVVALDYNTWGTSSGVDTTWHAVLSKAGIENGSARYEQGDFGQVAMSKELIVALNPDLLFLPGWVYGDDEGADKFFQQILKDPSLQSVKAIRTERLYQLPERLKGTYSQYIVDTIGTVVDAVHADLK